MHAGDAALRILYETDTLVAEMQRLASVAMARQLDAELTALADEHADAIKEQGGTA